MTFHRRLTEKEVIDEDGRAGYGMRGTEEMAVNRRWRSRQNGALRSDRGEKIMSIAGVLALLNLGKGNTEK